MNKTKVLLWALFWGVFAAIVASGCTAIVERDPLYLMAWIVLLTVGAPAIPAALLFISLLVVVCTKKESHAVLIAPLSLVVAVLSLSLLAILVGDKYPHEVVTALLQQPEILASIIASIPLGWIPGSYCYRSFQKAATSPPTRARLR